VGGFPYLELEVLLRRNRYQSVCGLADKVGVLKGGIAIFEVFSKEPIIFEEKGGELT
jgi:hypothetical protein